MTTIRIVDFETAGEAPPFPVIEVGICDLNLETKSISAPRSWLCHAKEISPETRAIHHITVADVASAHPYTETDIYHESIDAYAAHNASFERQWMAPPKPTICTYKAALRAWPEAPSHSNGALRYWLDDRGDIRPDAALCQPAHRAGPDAYVTAHILLALFNAGLTGKQMIAWTKEPALLPRCPLNPHRGKPWAEVDSGFLTWMIGKPDIAEDFRWNARREMERRS